MVNKLNFKTLLFPVIALFFFITCGYQHGLHPVQITGINGTVTFVGIWPENTEWVRILCFPQKPKSQGVTDLLLSLFDAKIGDPIPENSTTHQFTLELEEKTYQWLVVVFNSKEYPFKVIGEYSDQNGMIIVEKGKLITGIEITADFGVLDQP